MGWPQDDVRKFFDVLKEAGVRRTKTLTFYFLKDAQYLYFTLKRVVGDVLSIDKKAEKCSDISEKLSSDNLQQILFL